MLVNWGAALATVSYHRAVLIIRSESIQSEWFGAPGCFAVFEISWSCILTYIWRHLAEATAAPREVKKNEETNRKRDVSPLASKQRVWVFMQRPLPTEPEQNRHANECNRPRFSKQFVFCLRAANWSAPVLHHSSSPLPHSLHHHYAISFMRPRYCERVTLEHSDSKFAHRFVPPWCESFFFF